MKILVTGGAGFIGSHLAEHLLTAGHQLILIDNFEPSYPAAEKSENLTGVLSSGHIELVRVDICDTEVLKHVMKAQAPEAVVHLAALAGVRSSFDRPLDYVRINVAGTMAVLEACLHSRVRRLVFASSSSIYGARRTPFREDHVDNTPVSPYGGTKLAGERLCQAYAGLGSLTVVCLRLFSVYGPRQRPDLACRRFIEGIVGRRLITILGNGNCQRDYTYIGDIVRGISAALDIDCRFEAINLGRSQPTSINALLACLEEIIGIKARIIHADAHPGDVAITCADLEKAARLLGWSPRTTLLAGLEKSVAWFTRAPDRYPKSNRPHLPSRLRGEPVRASRLPQPVPLNQAADELSMPDG